MHSCRFFFKHFFFIVLLQSGEYSGVRLLVVFKSGVKLRVDFLRLNLLILGKNVRIQKLAGFCLAAVHDYVLGDIMCM